MYTCMWSSLLLVTFYSVTVPAIVKCAQSILLMRLTLHLNPGVAEPGGGAEGDLAPPHSEAGIFLAGGIAPLEF